MFVAVSVALQKKEDNTTESFWVATRAMSFLKT
jgi:hypothetical protein